MRVILAHAQSLDTTRVADVVDSPVPKLVLVGLVALSVVAVWAWFTFLGRKRLIEDLPTSAVKGVALGLNELLGRVDSAHAVPSPQAAIDCVWWENVFYNKDEDSNWRKTNETQGGPAAFSLQDETGSILVRPRHAAVHAPKVYDGPVTLSGASGDPNPTLATRYIAGRSGSRRTKVVERVIKVGDPVYVLGTAQLPVESLNVYIGPDREDGEPFLVHVGSEKDALFTQRVATIVGFLVAVAAAAGAGVASADGQAIERGGFDWTTVDTSRPLLFVAPVLALMAVAMIVFMYNGLVRLHHRARASWGLIDVQLRRRHDLIPNLVEAVRAHGEHENTVQTSVAHLRSTLTPQLPTRPSDAAVEAADSAIRSETVALRQLLALAEAYPVLAADQSYSALRDQLVDTEDRVALAREFYNNSVKALHDRARVFPGAAVAWVFGLRLEAEFLGDLGGARVPSVSKPVEQSWVVGRSQVQG